MSKLEKMTDLEMCAALTLAFAGDPWLIWSNKMGAWALKGEVGYTLILARAGRFTEAEAFDVCEQHFKDRGVPPFYTVGDDVLPAIAVPLIIAVTNWEIEGLIR